MLDTEILDAIKRIIDTSGPYYSAADLSAGSGEVIDYIECDTKYIGDIQEGYEFQGTVDETLPDIDYVHLFVLTYQFHVLPDPLATLYKIREKAAWVLVTDWVDDVWTIQRVTETLTQAELQPTSDLIVNTPDGEFHVWLCRNLVFSQPDPVINEP